jgi:hypothetical protein
LADPGPLQILADRAAAFLEEIAQSRIHGGETGAKAAKIAACKFFHFSWRVFRHFTHDTMKPEVSKQTPASKPWETQSCHHDPRLV